MYARRDRHGPDGHPASWSTPSSPRTPVDPVARRCRAPGRRRTIENALLDIKGKALGVPSLPAVRRQAARAHPGLLVALRLPTACAIRRSSARQPGPGPTRISPQGRRGGQGARLHRLQDQHRDRDRRHGHGLPAGLRGQPRLPRAGNWDAFIARSAARARSRPSRQGVEADVGIMLDTNFHFRTRGFTPHRRRGGAGQAHLARTGRARSEVDRAAAPRRALPDRLGRRRCWSAATSGPTSRPTPLLRGPAPSTPPSST